jgi:hypothetical protein
MRKTTVFCCLLVLGLIAVQRVPAQQSIENAKPQDTVRQADPPIHFYRLDLVLEQVDSNGKVTNSRSYSTTISTAHGDANAEIRTGGRIPIATGAFEANGGKSTQWQYQDVGVNIDARNARDVAGKLSLYLAADVTSVADAKESNGMNYQPVIEQNKWQGQVLIPIGKATPVFSSDDIRSKGAMRLLVTATLLQ